MYERGKIFIDFWGYAELAGGDKGAKIQEKKIYFEM